MIDFTEDGKSGQGNSLFEANPGGAPCNVLAMLAKLHTLIFRGKASAAISFLRTFGFITVFLLTLPRCLKVTGVWLAVLPAEFFCAYADGMSAMQAWETVKASKENGVCGKKPGKSSIAELRMRAAAQMVMLPLSWYYL